MLSVHLTLQSKNRKTGPMPVSTTSAITCPSACPLKHNGCYADGGPLGMHWAKVTAGLAGMAWDAFCNAISELPIGTLWRHNQAGDLPGENGKIDRKALTALVKANKGKRGFTFTHKPATKRNLAAIAAANRAGFTINLSANNPAHADKLAETGAGPVVVVLPHDATENSRTPAGRVIALCPATWREDVSCIDCGACANPNRKAIIGFPAHGSSHKRASAIAAA